MSKERLEEIRNRMIVEKHYFKYLNNEKGYWENVYTLLEQDMKYLFDTIIEQADRVQELEELIDKADKHAVRNGKEIMKLTDEKTRLEIENKRYREALEEIVHQENLKETNVFGYDHEDISSYVEEVARKALEGEE